MALPDTITGLSVTRIGRGAFANCISLTGVHFEGNAPRVDAQWYFGGVFAGSDNATIYHLPGTTGWETTFVNHPEALWVLPYPVILNSGPSFGVQTNAFGFVISWATNASVVVDAATDLANPDWTPVGTNTFTGGVSYFSDPQWTNHPARFYRLRSP